MKTLLILASLVFLTLPGYAADIKLSGDIRLRSIATDNLDADDTKDDRQTFSDGRFRIKTAVSSEKVTAIVTLDIVNDFNDACPSEAGMAATVAGTSTAPLISAFSADGCGTGNYRMGTAAFGNSYNIVGVRDAYLLVKFDAVKFALGRKPFKLGHGLILEDTVDGVAAKVMTGPIETVIASIKLFERSAAGTTAVEDTDLYLLKFRLTKGEDKDAYGKGNSLFVTYLKDRKPSLLPFSLLATDEANLLTAGVMGDLSMGPHAVNFEVDYLAGELLSLIHI